MASGTRVTTMNQALFPPAPTGWRYINISDPDTLDPDPEHYPVLFYGAYKYTALSSDANDSNMLILGWDTEGNIVKEVVKGGARYLWQILVIPASTIVTFRGQSRNSVVVLLSELVVPAAAASVSTMDRALFPPAPSGGWYYKHSTEPDGHGDDPTHFPVLVSGAYTYTALSNQDNRTSMLIVGWDAQNNIVKEVELNGARYLFKIVFNFDTKTVTFIGQDGRSASTILDALAAASDSIPRISTMEESFFPTAPTGWKYTHITNPDKLEFDRQHYPVLLFGGCMYTALSKIDNSMNMLILGWNPMGRIVKRLPKYGTRYIWTITPDFENQQVTFTGQGSLDVVATLAELAV